MRNRYKLKVLYATTTGTAYDMAYRIRILGHRKGFSVEVHSMEVYNAEDLEKETKVLFICSTAGEGETPVSMKNIWNRLLLKSLPVTLMSNLEYSVFGLGDSSYQKYNHPAKKLFKRLKQLGAISLASLGLGDDQHRYGSEAGFREWIDLVFKALDTRSEYEESYELPPPLFTLTEVKGNDHYEFDSMPALVTKNERISHETHFQEIRHVEIELDTTQYYMPGDSVSIICTNSENSVNEFLKLMDLQKDSEKIFELSHSTKNQICKHKIPLKMKLKKIIERLIDLNSVPRYLLLEYMYKFCNEEIHKEKLQEWLQLENYDDFFEYSYKAKRTILEMLTDFKIKIPLKYLLEAIPTIFNRYFSIASFHNKKIQIMVGIIEYETTMKTKRTGICTSWISKKLKEGDTIPVDIVPGTLKIPPLYNTPIIMISPGLGFAPMRSLIQYRIQKKEYENYLFLGCRFEKKDFCYKKEINKYQENKQLWYCLACSRDQEEKIYVQHNLVKYKELLKHLSKNAYFYICGSSKNMPKQVLKALEEIIDKDTWSEITHERLWLESWS